MGEAEIKPVPLSSLVAEVQESNPEIQGAIHGAVAAGYLAKQAGALPDTQIMLQHLSVGSPRPFAGYTNSDFAYIGLAHRRSFPGRESARCARRLQVHEPMPFRCSRAR
jgi:hypothetical protein